MGKKRTGVIALTACATFLMLMTVQAIAQPSLGATPVAEVLGMLGGGSGSSMSSDSGGGFPDMSAGPEQGADSSGSAQSASSDQTLPGLAPASGQEDGAAQPNRFDGGVTVRQETRGESFTPDEGEFAELRNPSFFERHTVAEDHTSVRTCLAAGEVCRAEFDVIIATSEESEYESAILINDEQVLPPPEDE